jgi:hypothetical protein
MPLLQILMIGAGTASAAGQHQEMLARIAVSVKNKKGTYDLEE